MLAAEEMVLENMGIVHHECRKVAAQAKRYGYDYDDLVQHGAMALIRAADAYDPSRGTKFSALAFTAVQRGLWMLLRAYKAAHRGKGLVPCSLDAESDEGLSLLDSEGAPADFSGLVVEEFLMSLGERGRKIVKMRMAGATTKEIGAACGLSQSMISRVLGRIGREYERLDRPKKGWIAMAKQNLDDVQERLDRGEDAEAIAAEKGYKGSHGLKIALARSKETPKEKKAALATLAEKSTGPRTALKPLGFIGAYATYRFEGEGVKMEELPVPRMELLSVDHLRAFAVELLEVAKAL